MSNSVSERLQALRSSGVASCLSGLQHGIEKEGLRVDAQGRLAQTPHPQALGSALTNGRITTDYSEALLEFITPVFDEPDKAIDYLRDLHRFTFSRLGDEQLWNASMPCYLSGPEDIPIARYGDSNIGQMKYVYRVGLEHRYGKKMQAIAGIHYNFSVPEAFWPAYQRLCGNAQPLQDFQSACYFSLIRNFRRYSWLLIYLFGASPVVDKSYLNKSLPELQSLDDNTFYAPYATSLRMSNLGYSNEAQGSLNVCYNRLDTYVDTISAAISKPYPAYEAMGIKQGGEYIQLNTNLLQIENEYYSDIRPKRVTRSGEKPARALKERGVEYVEVRNLDINPYLDVGIDVEQARFIDCFLLFCLLSDGKEIDADECDRIKENQQRVVWQGRDPQLTLVKEQGAELVTCTMRDWANELLEAMQPVAALLDEVAVDKQQGNQTHASLMVQRQKVQNPELTPSGQMLKQMQTQGLSYTEFAQQCSKQQRQLLLQQAANEQLDQELAMEVEASIRAQQAIEAADELDFDSFLSGYFAQ